MPFRDVLEAMTHRWYITLAAVTLAAFLVITLGRGGGTYSTRTVVTFTLPHTTDLTPQNGSGDPNLIAFAGAVAQQINDGKPAALYASDDAPLYGAGVRQGVLVGLPNDGSQWMASYSRAEIEIQVVGRTENWVAAKQRLLLDEVLRIAGQQQSSVSTPADQRFTVAVMPVTSNIDHIIASRTSKLEAYVAALVAALLVSGWVSINLERPRVRPRTRVLPRRSPANPTTPRSTLKGSLT
jgi:hypothetical protein